MYNFFKQNKNVILMAVSLFVVSLTVLMFFLSNQVSEQSAYNASVVDSVGTHGEVTSTESKYDLQIGAHDGAIVAVNLDGSIDYVSEELTYAYDLTEQEVKENLYFNYIHPDDLPAVMASIGQVFANESPVAIIGPFRMKIKQPDYTVFIASLYPIFENGKVTSVAVLLRDITDDINLPSEELEIVEDSDVEPSESTEDVVQEKIEKQTEFLQLYNDFKQDIIEEIQSETVQQELPEESKTDMMGDQGEQLDLPENTDNEVNMDSLSVPQVTPEEPQTDELTPADSGDKKDKKIRDKKDKDSRLLVQNGTLNMGIFSPFWPFLSR